MPFANINNEQIFYVLHRSKAGENKKTVILIHGAGGNHLSMLPLFNYIKNNHGRSFNIIAPDLPGHFRSKRLSSFSESGLGNPYGAYNINHFAATIKHLLLKLQLIYKKNAILIGHSMGAPVCLCYSSLFPEDVSAIMAIAGCTNITIRDSFIANLENNFERTIKLFLKDAYPFGSDIFPALLDIRRTPPAVVINDFKSIKSLNKEKTINFNTINNNNIYVHLIYSGSDKIIKENCVISLSKMLKNVKLKKIASKSHMEMLLKNPELDREIDNFLSALF